MTDQQRSGSGPGAPLEIAIVMLTAVGDVVHVLPVVNSLRAAYPDGRITWIVQPGPLGLVAGHPGVDELIPFDRKKGWRAYLELRQRLRGRRFDVVLALQDYFKAGLITAMLRAPRKIGIDRARARDLNWLFTTERVAPRPRGHTQDQYLEFLQHLGIPTRLDWSGLGPTPEEASRYATLLPPHPGPTVAIVIGTSRPAKEWPEERYAALADRVQEELGGRAVIVGGRSAREEEAAARIRELARHPPLDLREWDLRRVVYLLDRADVVVSPDTGPLHVAVALGTPSVALMGYTNPKRVGPYRFRELMVDAFGDPGEDYGVDELYRPGRMERIEVETVMDRVRLALERYGRGSSSAGHAGP
ncbi:MAG TPA: glycosyltransferase family 9 protein [Longimicrobiaceae bacterium]